MSLHDKSDHADRGTDRGILRIASGTAHLQRFAQAADGSARPDADARGVVSGHRTGRTSLVRVMAAYLCLSTFSASADDDREVRLKAAILYKLSRYVVWLVPPGGRAPSTLRYCVMGDDALFGALAEVDGREVDGRLLDVAQTPSTAHSAGCDLLYLGQESGFRAATIDALTRATSALLVSEAPGFADRGGGIELIRRNRRFGFRVNLGAVRAQGLNISSSLLDLAEVVNDDGGGRP